MVEAIPVKLPPGFRGERSLPFLRYSGQWAADAKAGPKTLSVKVTVGDAGADAGEVLSVGNHWCSVGCKILRWMEGFVNMLPKRWGLNSGRDRLVKQVRQDAEVIFACLPVVNKVQAAKHSLAFDTLQIDTSVGVPFASIFNLMGSFKIRLNDNFDILGRSEVKEVVGNIPNLQGILVANPGMVSQELHELFVQLHILVGEWGVEKAEAGREEGKHLTQAVRGSPADLPIIGPLAGSCQPAPLVRI